MPAAVHILCGPAWAGKTEKMLDAYRARLADAPGSALWLAPTLRAVEAVRGRLLQATAALCCPRLFTFHDVLREVVRVNDPAARPLTAAQRRLLAEEAAAEPSGGPDYFAGVADTRGFADGVLGLLAELQRDAVPPERFAEAAGACGTKGRQCARLYRRYHDELERQNLYDADTVAARACALLRRGLRRPFAEVRAVFVDGFADFTRPQHDFLDLLCGWVEDLWLALPGEEGAARADLFARPRATAERLAKLRPQVACLASGGRQPPDDPARSPAGCGIRGLTPSARRETPRPAGLTHLERQLFRPIRSVESSDDTAGLALIEAPGVLGEARLVVRRIKELLLAGAAADGVLVVLRDVAPYADVLAEVFDEYGVPAEVEGAEPLTRNPAAAALLRAARLPDDDWPFAGVTALLRNTYFHPAWPEADGDMPQKAEALLRLLGEPRGRESYLRAVQRWAEAQQPGLEDEDAEESRRRRTHELAGECANFVFRFFRAWDDAPAAAPLAEHLDWLRRFAAEIGVVRAAEEAPRDAAALDLLWDEAARWLDREERRHGPGGRRMDRKTFLRRLTVVAAECSLARGPAVPGLVRVLSANQARHLEADHVFVMGLGERSFPRLTPPQTLLGDEEWQALRDAGLAAGPGDPLPEEMLLFYQVVTRARRMLALSFPAVDERGQDLLPSSFLEAVRRCFAPKALERVRQSRRMLIESFYEEAPLSAAEYRVRAAAAWEEGGLHDPALPTGVRANLCDAAELFRLRFRHKDHNACDGRLRDPAAAVGLARRFGADHVFSPTALEDYVACPFKFFLRHALRLEPLEDPGEEIEVTRRGQAFHRALARLHRKLQEAGVHTPADDVAGHMAREMAAAVEEDVRRAPGAAAKQLWRLEGERLLKLSQKYLEHWRSFVGPWQGRKVAPRPHEFEADFGPPSPRGPLVIRVDGVEVRLGGRIDRIDLAELDDGLGFWVIDYKTGASKHYTGADLTVHRRLQLTLYALAVEEVLLAGRPARPLGLAYWMVGESGPKVALPGRAATQWLDDAGGWRAVRDRLRAWVAALARHILAGDFLLQPRDDDCTRTCGFGQICRITQARAVGKEGLLPLPGAGPDAQTGVPGEGDAAP